MNAPVSADTVTFHSTRAFTTSAEVWAVIKARHGGILKVFSSFSDPGGTCLGGPGERGVMETTYGLPSADYPLIGARTQWRINPEKPHERIDEQHEYFLFVAIKETDT